MFLYAVTMGNPRPEHEFDYSVWTPDTIVTLHNVPWNSDYRDVYRPENQAALNTYLAQNAGPYVRIEKLTYARFGDPIKISTAFNTAQKYNYLRVQNPRQPINGDFERSYYYFIMDVVHEAPNTTTLYVQLDVWHTFGYEFQVGSAYVEQGHIGIANANQFRNFGRDYLTVPEGLDVGGEYVIQRTVSLNIASARDDQTPTYFILLASSIDLAADNGTVDNPKLKMATGSNFENLPHALDFYVMSVSDFTPLLAGLRDKPHVIAGIQSITAIPFGRYDIQSTAILVHGTNVAISKVTSGALQTIQTKMAEDWRDTLNTGRYRNLDKMNTYPYTVIELTTNTGTPIAIKPEMWQDKDATVNEIPHLGGAGARIAFAPNNYNAIGAVAGTSDENGLIRDRGEFLDFATWIMNLPTFAVLNDGYQLFLANNRNGLAFQTQSADWGQQRAMMGADNSFNQASAGIDAANRSTQIGVNAAYAGTSASNEAAMLSRGVNAINSIGSGAAGGMIGLAGGLASAATGAAQTAIGVRAANQQTDISTGAANAQNANATGLSAYARDSNYDLAVAASRGDYQNTIAGNQAKVQDAALTQPTTAGQVGGDAFLLARYRMGVDLKIKRMTPDAMAQVGDYWLRFGYRINRFVRTIPYDFHVMQKFTYWKMKEVYVIKAECPEKYKQALRGIFEKGVTVWRNPNDMGRIDSADNEPLGGITL